jgi:hypothetical protein
MYQMGIKYPKWSYSIPNGDTIFIHFPIYGPPKFTQIGIFGLKINHLATLFPSSFLTFKLKKNFEIVQVSSEIINMDVQKISKVGA